jgi:hypothetical protein
MFLDGYNLRPATTTLSLTGCDTVNIESISEAEATLVITNDLLQHDIPPTTLESFTRVLVSNWTRRLRTYSEAMLSNWISFKFQGEWWWVGQLLDELEKEIIENPSLNFLGGLGGLSQSIRVPWILQETVTSVSQQGSKRDSHVQEKADTCLARIKHPRCSRQTRRF